MSAHQIVLLLAVRKSEFQKTVTKLTASKKFQTVVQLQTSDLFESVLS